jgi:hypothetical protein
MDTGVDAFVRPEHEEYVQDDAHASDEHHRNDDIQQEESICTTTRNIQNGNFFCVEVCEEHLGNEFESWHTCSLVVGFLYNGLIRMFHTLAWQQVSV